ncbi:hypothetical protein D3C76_1127910 [compost metagenome]
MSVLQWLIVDPDFVPAHFKRVALEAVQGWRFTQSAVLDPKLSLVPWARQPPMAERAFD